MVVKAKIKTGEYFDSVSLMLVARTLTQMDGVDDAAVVMGTEENKQILKASDMLIDEVKGVNDTDLVVRIHITFFEGSDGDMESLFCLFIHCKAERRYGGILLSGRAILFRT